MKKEQKFSFRSIKTFDDACKAIGIDPDSINLPGLTDDELAYRQLKIIVKAINDGWTPDWSNTNEAKWFPWFRVLPSGSGFSGSNSLNYCGFTFAGSRLCYETKAKSDYAATQFSDIYQKFLVTES
jgi:hypothetical protein